MNHIVALLISLAGLGIGRSDAVSCYECKQTSEDALSACPPTRKCTGVACVWKKYSLSIPFFAKQYTVEESCLQDEASSIVRECEQPEPGGKYFVVRQRCCYNQDDIVDTVVHLGASGMHCQCQSDYCNGDTSKEITGTTLKTVGPSLEMVDPSLQTVDPSLKAVGKSVSLTISIFALASEIVCLRLALGMLRCVITIFAV